MAWLCGRGRVGAGEGGAARAEREARPGASKKKIDQARVAVGGVFAAACGAGQQPQRKIPLMTTSWK